MSSIGITDKIGGGIIFQFQDEETGEFAEAHLSVEQSLHLIKVMMERLSEQPAETVKDTLAFRLTGNDTVN